jgi:3-phosphoshikimate 1-carboxyvinyltransferase
VRIASGPAPRGEVVVDTSHVPTLVPALAAVASSLPGGVRLTGAGHLRHHKTSRLEVLMAELARLGRVLTPVYRAGVLDGFVTDTVRPPGTDQVDSHGDHRLYMALYLAALAVPQTTHVAGEETLVTSFPDFVRSFADLAMQPARP